MKTEVKVFSTPSCPWCHKAKEYLKKKKVKFEDFNVQEDEIARKEMLDKSGQMGVPVIIVTKNGKELEPIVGFDQEELDAALK